MERDEEEEEETRFEGGGRTLEERWEENMDVGRLVLAVGSSGNGRGEERSARRKERTRRGEGGQIDERERKETTATSRANGRSRR